MPGYSNPQALNRYSYVLNNPVLYSDPSGHRPDDGCRTGEGCNVTAQTIIDDNKRANDFRQTTERNKCKAGNKNSCSYAENHPAETIAFVAGGLALTGVSAAAVSYMSATEMAAAVNAGISVLGDCITTSIGGGQCTAQNAAIAAAFSVGMGVLGGFATELIQPKSAGGILGLVASKVAIQMGGNTLQRTIRGEATNTNQVLMDEASGGVSMAIQMFPDTNVYVLSHIAEAVSSMMSAAGTFNSNPATTLIPGN